jgi:outer membrane protein OmpA-like peptidoglycan-associated protein
LSKKVSAREAELIAIEAAKEAQAGVVESGGIGDESAEALIVSPNAIYTVTVAHFEFNKWNLTANAKKVIAQEAAKLKGLHYVKVIIIGHTDDIGSERANAMVSLRRADAVFREFVKNGIDPDKIEYWGVGAQYPVAPNSSPNNRARNRRTTMSVE